MNPNRFFYQTMKSSVVQMLSGNILRGDAFTITEDLLSATRGIIYDWCLHNGSYNLSEKALRVTDMVLSYYKKS